MENNYKTVQIIIAILALLSIASLYAQPPVFDAEVEDGIPLDGGLSLLIAGAVAYGIRSLRGGGIN